MYVVVVPPASAVPHQQCCVGIVVVVVVVGAVVVVDVGRCAVDGDDSFPLPVEHAASRNVSIASNNARWIMLFHRSWSWRAGAFLSSTRRSCTFSRYGGGLSSTRRAGRP